MEFFIVFLIFAAALWMAWRRPARSAVCVFAAGLVLTIALYLHHATDALPLSF
jgi:hypothetical protein